MLINFNKNSKSNNSNLLLYLLIIILIISNILTYKLNISSSIVDEKVINNEIENVKMFINDWYCELSSENNTFELYYNELRFNNGLYTLTFAGSNLRAVYQKKERLFKLNYITYIEFYRNSGCLQCRLYYNETEEYIFEIK